MGWRRFTRSLNSLHSPGAPEDERVKRLKKRLRAQKREMERLRMLSRPPMFFLVGQAKSGTSWLMRTFNAHPEILCRGEGRFFCRWYKDETVATASTRIQPSSLYAAFLDADYLSAWIDRSVWTREHDKDEVLRRITGAAIRQIFSERLAEAGKRIAGDKTPFMGDEIVAEMHAICPEAKIVHIIRDGRDIAVSWMYHARRHGHLHGGILSDEEIERLETHADVGMFTEERLREIASRWRDNVTRAIEDGPRLFGENYAEVRYEELLERPEEEVGRLLRFLDADASENIVKRCVKKASFERWTRGRRQGEEDPTSLLRKGVAGDWKNVFTEGDKEVFEDEAGDLLVRLGYEKDRDW
jgi:Sulfotransferase family